MARRMDGQMDVVTGLVRSSYLVNAVYAQSARALGLPPQQGQLLCVLMPQPYPMSELGAILGLAKSSLTGLVDRTARRGLVRRETCQHDARAVMVALTEEGAALAEEFYQGTRRRIDALLDDLSGAERTALAELLGRVVETNRVPVVFLEPDGEPAPAGDRHRVPNSSA
ncbi:MarR family winged helix-turn-helix transcriptional regulator [Streptomyces sp. NPDC059578]|uniref:MarR family winged helix-turn-helix transcriptional regulator n=1 Tax=unclassified Streptomyces TaxID=2593676 RepID=UPI003661B186